MQDLFVMLPDEEVGHASHIVWSRHQMVNLKPGRFGGIQNECRRERFHYEEPECTGEQTEKIEADRSYQGRHVEQGPQPEPIEYNTCFFT